MQPKLMLVFGVGDNKFSFIMCVEVWAQYKNLRRNVGFYTTKKFTRSQSKALTRIVSTQEDPDTTLKTSIKTINKV